MCDEHRSEEPYFVAPQGDLDGSNVEEQLCDPVLGALADGPPVHRR